MNDTIWRTRAMWLIFALAAVRILVVIILPLDLGHDETYYWEWSRRVDWGYASKPPLIAWLIALTTRLFGDSPFAVRLPAIVFGTGILPWLYCLTADIYGRRAGFWAVVIAATMPGLTGVALLASIDGPLLFCWAAALFTFWRHLRDGRRNAGWMTATVIALGLGLLSKQTMLAFFPLALLFLLIGHDDRRELWRPAIWIAAVAALAMSAPVLLWNARHGWVMFHHTGEHFADAHATFGDRLLGLAEFFAGSLGLLSPITAVLIFYALGVAAMALPRLARPERFLFCFSGPALLGTCLMALKQPLEANWPAPFYLAAVPLIVGCCLGQARLPVSPRIGPRTLVRSAAAGALCIAVLGWLVFDPRVNGRRIDIAARLRGWKDLGAAVDAVRLSSPRPERTFVIVVGSRIHTSELAFYLPGRPRVYLWDRGVVPRSQYSLWGGPKDLAGWDALIVMGPSPKPPPSEMTAAFRGIKEQGFVDVPVGHGRRHVHRIWLASGFSRWPEN